jgi:hypothetical protein
MGVFMDTPEDRHQLESHARDMLQQALATYIDSYGGSEQVYGTCKHDEGHDSETVYVYHPDHLDNPHPGARTAITRIRVDVIAEGEPGFDAFLAARTRTIADLREDPFSVNFQLANVDGMLPAQIRELLANAPEFVKDAARRLGLLD